MALREFCVTFDTRCVRQMIMLSTSKMSYYTVTRITNELHPHEDTLESLEIFSIEK